MAWRRATGRIYGAEGCAWCRCRARRTSPTTTPPPTSGPWPRRRLLRRRRSPASSGDRIDSSTQQQGCMCGFFSTPCRSIIRLSSCVHACICNACRKYIRIYHAHTIIQFLLLLVCKGCYLYISCLTDEVFIMYV